MESFILLTAMVIMLILGGPIGFVLIMLPAIYVMMTGVVPLAFIPSLMFESINSVPLVAIPFFMLTGELMTSAAITERLVTLAKSMVGRLRGSLAQISIVVSMFFAGINGSVVADCTTVGSILLPSMKKAGYSPAFGAAVLAVAGTIGGIIPPSIAMVILANAAGGLSVGGLFSGGILPGIMIGLTLMAITWFIAKKRNYERATEGFKIMTFLRALVAASSALIIPVVLVGSIVGGIASPSEGGALTAWTAAFIGLIITRMITWESLKGAFVRAFKTSASVFIIISASGPFAWLLTRLGTIEFLEKWLTSYVDQPVMFAIVLVSFIYFLGMIMDSTANIIVVGPILVKVSVLAGYHEITAALLVVVGFLIGTATPPIGIAYFVTSAIAGARLERTAWEMIPYLIALFFFMFLILVIPEMTLGIPRILGFLD